MSDIYSFELGIDDKRSTYMWRRKEEAHVIMIKENKQL